ncbi:MAG: hypothetical protein AAF126_12135 [Chloroflexota bacterium]
MPFCVTAEGSKIGDADGKSSAERVKCAFSDVVSRFGGLGGGVFAGY